MEHTHESDHTPNKSHTTPKDFFLWLGVLVTLYGTIIAFFTLVFDYVNTAFPDPLAYAGDPFGGAVRGSMATLIVFVPILLGLLVTIRRDIVRTPGKAHIWIRRWALVFTIFLASATAAVTLITLITTFLGGEITMRFALKAIVVLLIAIVTALHFLADLRGYWTLHRRRANRVGAGVGALAIMTIAAGFLIIGSPKHIRDLRLDQQRVSDLQNLQSEVATYWQLKRALPKSLEALNDPLTGMNVPKDPISAAPYAYQATSATSFSLCADFATDSADASGKGAYPSSYPTAPYGSGYGGIDGNFAHGAGHTCFNRTIDPQKFPPAPTDTKMPL